MLRPIAKSPLSVEAPSANTSPFFHGLSFDNNWFLIETSTGIGTHKLSQLINIDIFLLMPFWILDAFSGSVPSFVKIICLESTMR